MRFRAYMAPNMPPTINIKDCNVSVNKTAFSPPEMVYMAVASSMIAAARYTLTSEMALTTRVPAYNVAPSLDII